MLFPIVAVCVALLYAVATWRGLRAGRVPWTAYPSPDEAEAEIDALAAAHPELCRVETIGRSTEGRPLRALRLCAPANGSSGGEPARLLVTANLHAVEYIGGFVARAVARRLATGYGRDPVATRLLDSAEVVIVALANPDGAARVWRRGGWSTLGAARFTANGVDPNRNFPFEPLRGRGAWNSGREKPGSAWYRGPAPLSEPECAALAALARRERFCGAVNFHSFGCVVYLPALGPEADPAARRALSVFQGVFQSRQRRPYRAVPERSAAIVGQLDPFLLGAFGTPSVTVEVSRPGLAALTPGRLGNLFALSNPPDPERWAENDAPAAILALDALIERTGGLPCRPAAPGLGAVPKSGSPLAP